MRKLVELSAHRSVFRSLLLRNLASMGLTREGTSTKAKGDDGALSKRRLALFLRCTKALGLFECPGAFCFFRRLGLKTPP